MFGAGFPSSSCLRRACSKFIAHHHNPPPHDNAINRVVTTCVDIICRRARVQTHSTAVRAQQCYQGIPSTQYNDLYHVDQDDFSFTSSPNNPRDSPNGDMKSVGHISVHGRRGWCTSIIHYGHDEHWTRHVPKIAFEEDNAKIDAQNLPENTMIVLLTCGTYRRGRTRAFVRNKCKNYTMYIVGNQPIE